MLYLKSQIPFYFITEILFYIKTDRSDLKSIADVTIGRVYRFSQKKHKKSVKKSFDRKNCTWLERAFKGRDLYVFNFCVAFISSLKKDETSWSFFQLLNFIKILSISVKQHFAELGIATPSLIQKCFKCNGVMGILLYC